MAFSTQQNFLAELDGTTVYELNQKIDYSKLTLDERKREVESILENTDFYSEYFSEHFKGSINSGDSLSQEINVCKSLEKMANYLLNSEEVRKMEDAEQTKYVFHTDAQYFRKKIERESSLEFLLDSGEGTIHFLKRNEKNYKKPKTQVITKDDLDRKDELGEILRNLQAYSEFINQELKNPNTKFNRYLLTKIKGQLSADMVYIKEKMLGVFGEDFVTCKEGASPDLDVFDFTNHSHLNGFTLETTDKKGRKKKEFIKGLLYFKPYLDLNNDFSIILTDLQNTIDKANLTDIEKYVLNEMRNGSTKKEVAETLNCSHVKVTRTMEIIASKVAKVGNKYDAKEKVLN